MKILHINYTFGVVGGTESHLYKLIGNLAERGHTSEVAAEKDLTDGTVARFHELPEVAGYDRHWPWRHGRRLKQIVRLVQPDLIHIHNTLNAGVVKLAARLRPAIRFVHDHTVFCPGLNKEYTDGGLCDHAMGAYCLENYHRGGCFCFRHPSESIAARYLRIHQRLLHEHRRLKKLIVASAYMRDKLIRVGVPGDRIVVNPYYVDVPEPGETLPAETSPADPDSTAGATAEAAPPLVLTLCRMEHPDKGVIPLLDALARIEVPFRAELVGTGKHLAMFEEHAARLGLTDRVAFPGFVPHEQALVRLGQARVVVFPSMWNEPFGIVGLEAMARRKPVVAFDVGGVHEWLARDQTGLVVERGNVGAMAGEITALLTDPDRAKALSEAGPDRVRSRFVKTRHLDVLEGVYREATGVRT